jgi:hypothetical protein
LFAKDTIFPALTFKDKGTEFTFGRKKPPRGWADSKNYTLDNTE